MAGVDDSLDVEDNYEDGKKLSAGSRTASLGEGEGGTSIPRTPSKVKERERKIGHRRVDDEGHVTYKKKNTSELMTAIQLAIGQSIGSLTSKPDRDLLMQDFTVVESVFFPSEGSNLTPAHRCADFRFKTYAPIAFRYFRDLFGIRPDDFLMSLCDQPMRELSNPGASGSIFYITQDDEFIIKTVQHKEAEFLQKLLPGYYMNLNQNPRTLLPKFYGLFCYQHGGKNVRLVVMNNLLPSALCMSEKYDLKGSTYKRRASKYERQKSSPTLKDLDFAELHPEGVKLEGETHHALIQTINRDCRVLESFKIMDFSLLLGVFNIDQQQREKTTPQLGSSSESSSGPGEGVGAVAALAPSSVSGLTRGRSTKHRLAQYSTPIESIQPHNTEPVDLEDDDVPVGGIPARNTRGDRLLLFVGIIDILQSYRLKKKMEHAWKSMLTDGDTVSVHRPSFYSNRFQDFFSQRVFAKIPTPLRHTPSKRKSVQQNRRATDPTSPSEDLAAAGTVGERPDLLPSSTSSRPRRSTMGREEREDRVEDRVSEPQAVKPEDIELKEVKESRSARGKLLPPIDDAGDDTSPQAGEVEEKEEEEETERREEESDPATDQEPQSTEAAS